MFNLFIWIKMLYAIVLKVYEKIGYQDKNHLEVAHQMYIIIFYYAIVFLH